VTAMPFLMSLMCGLTMLASPIFLLALCFPTESFHVNGREVTFTELWK
jgi:hypothetical protein